MRIWIDLANSPHVPFFRALMPELLARAHKIEVTARDFAQTVELARAVGLEPAVIGAHGGRSLAGKAGEIAGRAIALGKWARKRRFDLSISHNSYAQILASRFLGVTSVTLMDYEHQPANHLAFRLANRVIVPAAFPEDALRRYGATPRKVLRYEGIKEDVYLADFSPAPGFADFLQSSFGINHDDVFVLARPPAREALYHRFENEIFDDLLEHLSRSPRVKLLVLARSSQQREELAARHTAENVILPREALDGANLVSAADLVVSAGGTMNREAAALGVPAASVYAGRWAAVDEQLVREGRLRKIATRDDALALKIQKKELTSPRHALGVRDEVIELILRS